MLRLGIEATNPQVGIVLAGVGQQFVDRFSRYIFCRHAELRPERQRHGNGGKAPRAFS